MQNNVILQLGLWLLYFITDIYGHVGFKFASQPKEADLLRIIFSVWGLTAGLAWALSAVLWITILSQNHLFKASSIGALTYALMIGAAVVVFREPLTAKQLMGTLLIGVGIYFATSA